jgi:hypothetical protein
MTVGDRADYWETDFWLCNMCDVSDSDSSSSNSDILHHLHHVDIIQVNLAINPIIGALRVQTLVAERVKNLIDEIVEG